jgi:excisionase family DNA binding protein
MEGQEKLYTTQEAARELGISYTWLRALIVDKIAQPAQQIGGTWLFTSEEIERLRTSRRPPGRPKKQ